MNVLMIKDIVMGLKGKRNSFRSRIIALCDSIDAMSSKEIIVIYNHLIFVIMK